MRGFPPDLIMLPPTALAAWEASSYLGCGVWWGRNTRCLHRGGGVHLRTEFFTLTSLEELLSIPSKDLRRLAPARQAHSRAASAPSRGRGPRQACWPPPLARWLSLYPRQPLDLTLKLARLGALGTELT